MTKRPRSIDEQAGFTLVELLLAIAILGIGVLTVVGGMMTSIQVSDLGRRQADGQTELRAFAEAVAGATYVNCATSASYMPSYTAPSGVTASMAVAYWDGISDFKPACSADTGLQSITLTIATDDNRGSETVTMAKRTP